MVGGQVRLCVMHLDKQQIKVCHGMLKKRGEKAVLDMISKSNLQKRLISQSKRSSCYDNNEKIFLNNTVSKIPDLLVYFRTNNSLSLHIKPKTINE